MPLTFFPVHISPAQIIVGSGNTSGQVLHVTCWDDWKLEVWSYTQKTLDNMVSLLYLYSRILLSPCQTFPKYPLWSFIAPLGARVPPFEKPLSLFTLLIIVLSVSQRTVELLDPRLEKHCYKVHLQKNVDIFFILERRVAWTYLTLVALKVIVFVHGDDSKDLLAALGHQRNSLSTVTDQVNHKLCKLKLIIPFTPPCARWGLLFGFNTLWCNLLTLSAKVQN